MKEYFLATTMAVVFGLACGADDTTSSKDAAVAKDASRDGGGASVTDCESLIAYICLKADVCDDKESVGYDVSKDESTVIGATHFTLEDCLQSGASTCTQEFAGVNVDACKDQVDMGVCGEPDLSENSVLEISEGCF